MTHEAIEKFWGLSRAMQNGEIVANAIQIASLKEELFNRKEELFQLKRRARRREWAYTLATAFVLGVAIGLYCLALRQAEALRAEAIELQDTIFSLEDTLAEQHQVRAEVASRWMEFGLRFGAMSDGFSRPDPALSDRYSWVDGPPAPGPVLFGGGGGSSSYDK